MPRVILYAGLAFDQDRDAGQRPEPRAESMGAGPLAQRRVDADQLLRSQPRLAPRSTRGAQCLTTAVAPRVIPPHDALATHPQTPGDRALRLATRGKQPRGLLPANFQPMKIPSWSNMSGHASIVRGGRLAIVTILCETQ